MVVRVRNLAQRLHEMTTPGLVDVALLEEIERDMEDLERQVARSIEDDMVLAMEMRRPCGAAKESDR